MSRTTIGQFRALLAGDADQTALMRAYRELARRPTPVGGRVGDDGVALPPAAAAAGDWGPWAAEAHAAGDWLQWTREGGQPVAAGPSALFAGWPEWKDAPPREAAQPRLAGWGDWSTPPVAAA